MTQADGVYLALTVAENARFFAATYGIRDAGAVQAALALVELADRGDAIAGTLSGGQRRRLSLACALVHRPPVLFLDEPTVGVDPLLRVQFWTHFRALADAGTTIVVASHVMDEADRCDELLFIRSGKVIARGTRARDPRAGRHRRPRAGVPAVRRRRGGDPMNGRRIAALFRRVTEEIRRDRPSIALLFIAPLVITGLVTFILREGQTPDDRRGHRQPGRRSPARSWPACSARRSASQDATVTEAADEAAARALIEDGSATVAIVLPAELAAGGGRAVDHGHHQRARPDRRGGSSSGALQKALLSAATAASGAGSPDDRPRDRVRHARAATRSPAMRRPSSAFFVYFFVYLLTGVSFLRERTGGTLERLMATPVSRAEIVTGYTLGFGLFAFVQVTLLMVWVLGTIHVPAIGPLPPFSIGLGVPVAGSPLFAFIVVLVLAIGAVSLGIFLSSFARTELQIIQFIPIVIVPQFLLSGVLFPISSLPASSSRSPRSCR